MLKFLYIFIIFNYIFNIFILSLFYMQLLIDTVLKPIFIKISINNNFVDPSKSCLAFFTFEHCCKLLINKIFNKALHRKKHETEDYTFTALSLFICPTLCHLLLPLCDCLRIGLKQHKFGNLLPDRR